MTVVFDGAIQPAEVAAGAAAGVVVVFAPGGPDAADHVIAALAGALGDPGSATVVTSDAELARRAAAAGTAVLGGAAFGAVLRSPT